MIRSRLANCRTAVTAAKGDSDQWTQVGLGRAESAPCHHRRPAAARADGAARRRGGGALRCRRGAGGGEGQRARHRRGAALSAAPAHLRRAACCALFAGWHPAPLRAATRAVMRAVTRAVTRGQAAAGPDLESLGDDRGDRTGVAGGGGGGGGWVGGERWGAGGGVSRPRQCDLGLCVGGSADGRRCTPPRPGAAPTPCEHSFASGQRSPTATWCAPTRPAAAWRGACAAARRAKKHATGGVAGLVRLPLPWRRSTGDGGGGGCRGWQNGTRGAVVAADTEAVADGGGGGRANAPRWTSRRPGGMRRRCGPWMSCAALPWIGSVRRRVRPTRKRTLARSRTCTRTCLRVHAHKHACTRANTHASTHAHTKTH